MHAHMDDFPKFGYIYEKFTRKYSFFSIVMQLMCVNSYPIVLQLCKEVFKQWVTTAICFGNWTLCVAKYGYA